MKILWTDGSAVPNPGRGGYAVIEDCGNGKARVAAWGHADDTTNIRMEATAIINAIKYAGAEPCEIHTDSEFWINVLTKWAPGWAANGWRKKSRGAIENLDLVQELYELYTTHDVKLVWVRGHHGTPLNELADRTAAKARKNNRN